MTLQSNTLNDRGSAVLRLLEDGLRPSEISKQLEVSFHSVTRSVKWLTENGFWNPHPNKPLAHPPLRGGAHSEPDSEQEKTGFHKWVDQNKPDIISPADVARLGRDPVHEGISRLRIPKGYRAC